MNHLIKRTRYSVPKTEDLDYLNTGSREKYFHSNIHSGYEQAEKKCLMSLRWQLAHLRFLMT